MLQIRHLRANPDKPQVTAFHMRNEEKVKGEMEQDRSGEHAPYLGVTLDRILSYKQHIHNTKMKVATRNNLIRNLSSSKWGTSASTIRTTELALSYSVAEYVASVWAKSAHAYKLDSEPNSACRAITGGLKPTNVEELYLLSGITPPSFRRDVCYIIEKANKKQTKPTLCTGKSQLRDA